MKLLILGGTVFLGRHVARAALAREHAVTLFHRGRHAWDREQGEGAVETRVGDRRGGLGALDGGTWDAVVDLSGYFPDDVADSARRLASRAGRYVFVSSISAYAAFDKPGITEASPVLELSDDERREASALDRENPAHLERFGALYGALKVACEREVERALPGQALVVRPGLIVGPHDPTDRFTYWPERMTRGGDVLAPGRPGRVVQFIDVRDLAEWMVRLAERGETGVIHATGPASTLTMGEVLEACWPAQAPAPAPAPAPASRLEWRDDAELLAAGVTPWREMPLWIPESDASMAGFMRVDPRRAISAGLTFRPLADTVRDTRTWCATRPPGAARKAGITPERERELLALPRG